MVKYLSFRNSSFALRYFLCKWQGHSVTHPLFLGFQTCEVFGPLAFFPLLFCSTKSKPVCWIKQEHTLEKKKNPVNEKQGWEPIHQK